jgi:predicted ABC-type exoprotein transport system permease subunit
MYDARTAALRASAAYFGIVFSVGFLLGSIRVPFLVPRLGERTAELIEMPAMFVVIVFAAKFLVRRFGTELKGNIWLAVGALALLLMVAAELLLAVVLQSRSLAEYIASRDRISGAVYLGMLALFTAMPWLRQRTSARRTH